MFPDKLSFKLLVLLRRKRPFEILLAVSLSSGVLSPLIWSSIFWRKVMVTMKMIATTTILTIGW